MKKIEKVRDPALLNQKNNADVGKGKRGDFLFSVKATAPLLAFRQGKRITITSL